MTRTPRSTASAALDLLAAMAILVLIAIAISRVLAEWEALPR